MWEEEDLPNGGSKVQTSHGVFYYNSDDQYHREDGPAVILKVGGEAYYLNDIHYTFEEFERILKLKVFW